MSWKALIVPILRKIIPVAKIGGMILGAIAAVLALLMGVQGEEIKASFCASEVPKIELPAPTPAPPAK